MSGKKTSLFIFVGITFIVVVSFLVQANQKRPQTSLAVSPVAQTGEISRYEQSLPPGMPDFPVFPDAQLVSSYDKKEAGKVGYDAKWESNTPITDIVYWYQYQFTRNPEWTIIESPFNPKATESFYIVERNGTRFVLIVEVEDAKTEITLEVALR